MKIKKSKALLIYSKDVLKRIAVLERTVKTEKEIKQSEAGLRTIKTIEKCASNCSKIELAQFFYFLFEEKLLFFDEVNSRSNRSKIQAFIIENFTYLGDAGSQTEIHCISKQFSECSGYTYKEKQIQFLERLLNIIQKRQTRLNSW